MREEVESLALEGGLPSTLDPRPSTSLEVIAWSEPSVERNLAVDESLAQEASRTGRRVLRLWWGSGPTAVLGCGDKPESALDLDECTRRDVGWAKRVTGGGTVLQTPGVFNYSYTAPDSGCLDTGRVFEQGARLVVRALAEFGVSARQRGTSDVAVDDLKISGSAQARKWKAILLHGTLLVDMDTVLIEAVLKHPRKEPDYRNGRSHGDFIVTLNDLGITAGRTAIEEAFTSAALRHGVGE
jgi:lipoate---protein ligase